MATYKLIQDVEAEDKILGPLTLRQFIFAMIAAFLLYICFILITRHLYIVLILFVPPAVFCIFFAFPFGKDQPTELWALGKINYWFRPRRRIWNQSGVKELVTITVPKKVERVYTNGLSQTEVRSRLNALATTIDSRGWAVKNVAVNLYAPQPLINSSSDRLLDLNSIPQEVPNYDVAAADDMLDATSNPIAQQFDAMISRSSQQHRSQLINQLNSQPSVTMQQATGQAEPWFINPATPLPEPEHVSVEERQAEAELSSQLKARTSKQQVPYSHMRTLQPAAAAPQPVVGRPSTTLDATNTQGTAVPPTVNTGQASAMTPTEDPAILALATNDDLNVATLAREANKAKHGGQSQDEVVISLH